MEQVNRERELCGQGVLDFVFDFWFLGRSLWECFEIFIIDKGIKRLGLRLLGFVEINVYFEEIGSIELGNINYIKKKR